MPAPVNSLVLGRFYELFCTNELGKQVFVRVRRFASGEVWLDFVAEPEEDPDKPQEPVTDAYAKLEGTRTPDGVVVRAKIRNSQVDVDPVCSSYRLGETYDHVCMQHGRIVVMLSAMEVDMRLR